MGDLILGFWFGVACGVIGAMIANKVTCGEFIPVKRR